MIIYQKDEKTLKFIEKAKLVPHTINCDYNKSVYINAHTKLIITCLGCGNDFLQKPNDHLSGRGCPKCAIEYISKTLRSNLEDFIEKANKIHNFKYGYIRTIYINNTTKAIFTCYTHGDFEQRPSDHLQGRGCPTCGGSKRITRDEFISRANIIHNFKYGYTKIIEHIRGRIKVIITCLCCGNAFFQTPNSHLQGNGCLKCKESKGEKSIREYLLEKNILFDDQYSFINCRNILPLPFDFVLLDGNKNCKALIEYQGRHHFDSIEYWGGIENLKNVQHRDKIKLDYCANNNIPLLRIHYKDFKKIDELLENFIKELCK